MHCAWLLAGEEGRNLITLDVPWLELVEVDVGDDVEVDPLRGHLLGEVVGEQLLLRRMEPEPRRHHRLPVHRDAHDDPFPSLPLCVVWCGVVGQVVKERRDRWIEKREGT